jgi:hypothetical protein
MSVSITDTSREPPHPIRLLKNRNTLSRYPEIQWSRVQSRRSRGSGPQRAHTKKPSPGKPRNDGLFLVAPTRIELDANGDDE